MSKVLTDDMIQQLVDSIVDYPDDNAADIYTQRIKFMDCELNHTFINHMNCERYEEADKLLSNEIRELIANKGNAEAWDILADEEQSCAQLAGTMENIEEEL